MGYSAFNCDPRCVPCRKCGEPITAASRSPRCLQCRMDLDGGFVDQLHGPPHPSQCVVCLGAKFSRSLFCIDCWDNLVQPTRRPV
jgi:hypothetical protein